MSAAATSTIQWLTMIYTILSIILHGLPIVSLMIRRTSLVRRSTSCRLEVAIWLHTYIYALAVSIKPDDISGAHRSSNSDDQHTMSSLYVIVFSSDSIDRAFACHSGFTSPKSSLEALDCSIQRLDGLGRGALVLLCRNIVTAL
jgi:hypothetical protein